MIDKTSLRSYEPVIVKKHLPKAVREQLWIKKVGRVFDAPCNIRWCDNNMNAFDFHVGHNVPESRGGTLRWDNLIPICARCNLSMGSQFTIREWNHLIS
jgi:5-methylcytosine-specific restriction endonuclease McrA